MSARINVEKLWNYCKQNEKSLLYSDEESMQLECGARNVCFISAYFGVEVAHRISLFSRGKMAELDKMFIVPRDFE